MCVSYGVKFNISRKRGVDQTKRAVEKIMKGIIDNRNNHQLKPTFQSTQASAVLTR